MTAYIKSKSQARRGGGGDNNSTIDKSKCNWDASSDVDMTIFDDIMKLLMHVSNCEMAVMCSGWVVKEFPMGEYIIVIHVSWFLSKRIYRLVKLKTSPEWFKTSPRKIGGIIISWIFPSKLSEHLMRNRCKIVILGRLSLSKLVCELSKHSLQFCPRQ